MRSINKYWLSGTLVALCWLFHGVAQSVAQWILDNFLRPKKNPV